jgi:hypothetical protein
MQWKHSHTVVLIIALFWLPGCITDLGEESTLVHFSNLKVGQESRYVRLHGYKYAIAASNEYVQLPETLIVRVIGKDSIGFVCQDFLVRRPTAPLSRFDTVRCVYHLVIAQGILRVIGDSHLFWSWTGSGTDARLPMSPLGGKQFTVSGWKFGGEPYGNSGVGFVRNATINGVTYPLANVYYDHFEADGGDPSIPYYCGYIGVTFIYSEQSGIIRSRYVLEPWFDQGLCWDLIEP